MRLRTALLLLVISIWILPTLVVTAIYYKNPNVFGNYGNFLLVIFTIALVGASIMQAVTLFAQTKLIASPIVDAIARLTSDAELEMEIANVGNYVARNPQIIVDIEVKDRIFRYNCKVFPSLPPRSYYESYVGIVRIKPKFEWRSKDDKSKMDSVRAIDLVDLPTLLKRLQSESVEQISIRVTFIAENHEPITALGAVRSLGKPCVTITVLSRSRFKMLLRKLQRKISRKQVIEYRDQCKFEIQSL